MTLAASPRSPERAGQDAAPFEAGAVRETAAISATLCATVPLLLPLFERGMAATHDGFLHVQRLVAYDAALRQGAPFTRWLPDLAYGYGQPLLLYYAPLSYLPAIVARLFGAGPVTSFEFASGLALVLSGLAMYLLARSLCGPMAASVAAIVYVTLPYQLVDLYVRGALAETWAFVWLPLCAWFLTRAWSDRRPRWSVGLALSVAALVLTHNVTALLYLPALAVLACILQLGGGTRVRDVPPRPVLALGLGLVLSAWFWLPALAERHLVQIAETIEPELFASFFVRGWPPFRLEPLYDYQRPVSTALGSAIFWPQLGLVQVAVTALGGVFVVRATGIARLVGIWACLLATGGYLLQLQPLKPVYDLVPLLAFVQFPWRLLAVIGLGSALVAGLLVEVVGRQLPIRAAFAAAIVVMSLVTALARLDPEPTLVDERALFTESIVRAELADYGLGTTHSGEYLPVSSGQRNTARFRKTLIDAGGDNARRAPESPSTLQVIRLDWRPDRIVVNVRAQAPARLVLHQFAFPGWSAAIGGEPVATSAVGPLGLLGVEVPAGDHRIEFDWGWTPLRMGASAASLIGVLLLVPLASSRPGRPTVRASLIAFATVGLIAELLAPSWRSDRIGPAIEPESAPIRNAGEILALVEVRHDTSRLWGSVLPWAATPEPTIVSQLTWHVRQAPGAGVRAFVDVLAADGQLLHRAPWIYEPLSALWMRDEIVQTTVTTRLPPDLGERRLQLKLSFERPAGLPALDLGSLEVPSTITFAPDAAASNSVAIDERVTVAPLVAGEWLRTGSLRARPGQSIDVPLRWNALSETPNVGRDLHVVAALAVPGGDIVSEPRRAGDWFAPLPFWQRGERIAQNVRLALPPWLRSGTYPLAVRVYERDLARSGASEPGASSARPRGRPVAEFSLGTVTVER